MRHAVACYFEDTRRPAIIRLYAAREEAPAAIMVFERVAFGTTRIAQLLVDQRGGGTSAIPPAPGAPGATLMESMNAVPFAQLLVAPGLWVGFAVAAVFVAGAVRLRRSAQPL